MSDEIKHECAVALVVLRKDIEHYRQKYATGDYGGVKLSLLLEKQHNRGQDGAGVAILSDHPRPGEPPYWIYKSASATPLVDMLGMIARRDSSRRDAETPNEGNLRDAAPLQERIFLGHLRYATFGKNNVTFCHPFLHESSELAHTVLLAGNFNLTNAAELFEDYSQHGSFPTSKADGYLICELIAKELRGRSSATAATGTQEDARPPVARAISSALANADGAWTLCGMTGDGWAFATRDPHGIRPGFYYIDDDVAVVASERPAIQAAFDVPPEAVKELPPGETLVISPEGDFQFQDCSCAENGAGENSRVEHVERVERGEGDSKIRPCSFERIYFSRANDADIHRERKALGAALVPQILKAANAPIEDIFFSYIPNSARIAFHGLLEELFKRSFLTQRRGDAERDLNGGFAPDPQNNSANPLNPIPNISAPSASLREIKPPRFGEIAVKDAKFRTFIADAAARREFYKHVYDVTYGLVGENDTLVVLDDSIVRGNTMKNAILPMLDRLGPKRIVVASSAPPIRYPDCYGIDMSTLGELVAFRALVNLLDGEQGTGNGERELRNALVGRRIPTPPHAEDNTLLASQNPDNPVNPVKNNPLAPLYARFTEEQHCREIARLLTPPGMKAEVVVVYQTVENLRRCLNGSAIESQHPATVNSKLETQNSKLTIGDWYFTGDYPTPGGYKVLHKALANYLARRTDRSY